MLFRSAEDRLNPDTPHGADESTLGGYTAVHGRAASFSGSDGEPYTVAVETEHGGEGETPWGAYLVFLRWAATGTAVMGHMETGDLARGRTEAEARCALEALPLERIKQILDGEILRRGQEHAP